MPLPAQGCQTRSAQGLAVEAFPFAITSPPPGCAENSHLEAGQHGHHPEKDTGLVGPCLSSYTPACAIPLHRIVLLVQPYRYGANPLRSGDDGQAEPALQCLSIDNDSPPRQVEPPGEPADQLARSTVKLQFDEPNHIGYLSTADCYGD